MSDAEHVSASVTYGAVILEGDEGVTGHLQAMGVGLRGLACPMLFSSSLQTAAALRGGKAAALWRWVLLLAAG